MAALGAATVGAARAQEFPSRPITIVVPYSAGGGMDVLARSLGQRLGEVMKQSVIVENRTGANGLIGMTHVARARPDGYTLLMGNTTPNAVMPVISKELTFDPVKDFTPLSIVSNSPVLLVVNADAPVRTLADLLALGKGAGRSVNFGTLGVGATSHLVGAHIKSVTGTSIVYVPYRGEANTVAAVLGREVDVALITSSSASSHVQSGRMRAIANLGRARSPLYPDVPTLAEAGVPGLETDLWFGVMAPAGLPPAVADLLERRLREVAVDPAMKQRLEQLQMTVVGGSRQEFDAVLRGDLERFGRIARALEAAGELKIS